MLRQWCRIHKKRIILFIIVFVLCRTAYITLFRSIYREPDLSITRRNVEVRLAEALKEAKDKGCNIPRLDPFAPEYFHSEEKLTKIKCKGQDWVKCYLSECKVIPEILATTKNITCIYQDIMYLNDFKYNLGPSTVVMDDGTYVLKKSDHVKIKCFGTRNWSIMSSTWLGYATGFRTTVERKPMRSEREDGFNVLIFAFNSISKNMFKREMFRTYDYFTNDMKGTILDGYNIVGDGTPAALFPILTGKIELELPDARSNMNNNRTIYVENFIFHALKTVGYRTAYFEDVPNKGTFQYRFNGFEHQPADHYLRAFFMETESKWWPWPDHCVGDTPRFQLMMNLTDQFLQLDGKKFIFTFVADVTYDGNMMNQADRPMLELLKTLVARGALEDTLVIIMGDQGPRYSAFRDTLQTKLEERLPLMGICLPEKLIRKRPWVQSVLNQNVDALTTPHDIHATLLDALDLRQYYNLYKVEGADLRRGMTLLALIPRSRSCSEAGIEAHWCTCLSWHEVSDTEPHYRLAVNSFVENINLFTEVVRHQCVLRTLLEVKWVMRQTANKHLLTFAGAKDLDGYVGTFSNQFKPDLVNYRIKVVLAPGRGIFEATLKYSTRTEQFYLITDDISRTNAYQKEASCISNIMPHLQPFCYCKNNLH